MDDWEGVGPLYVLFFRIFRVVAKNGSSISDCYEKRDGGTRWWVPFRRSLHPLEKTQNGELLNFFSNVVCAGI